MTRPDREALANWLQTLDGPTLRHLAACADARARPDIIDPESAAADLAAMVETRGRPTVGWWRRHIRTTQRRDFQMTNEQTPASKVTRIGNLTRDPELRFSAKGSAWATTAIAVDRRSRRPDGTWEEAPPEFYDVVCFGDLSENVAASLSKGDRVIAVGKVEAQQWTGRDGVDRTGYKLIADDIGTSLRHGSVEVNRTSRRGPASVESLIMAKTADELFGTGVP